MKKAICTGSANITIGLGWYPNDLEKTMQEEYDESVKRQLESADKNVYYNALFAIKIRPKTPFYPKRIITNAPTEGFAIISCPNRWEPIDAFMASHRRDLMTPDLYDTRSEKRGLAFEQPWIHADEEITVYGYYTGFAPSPYYNGQAFKLFITLMGEAE